MGDAEEVVVGEDVRGVEPSDRDNWSLDPGWVSCSDGRLFTVRQRVSPYWVAFHEVLVARDRRVLSRGVRVRLVPELVPEGVIPCLGTAVLREVSPMRAAGVVCSRDWEEIAGRYRV